MSQIAIQDHLYFRGAIDFTNPSNELVTFLKEKTAAGTIFDVILITDYGEWYKVVGYMPENGPENTYVFATPTGIQTIGIV